VTTCDYIHSSLTEFDWSKIKVDTILMNPPFGTKLKASMWNFLKLLAKSDKIYTLHKTSTRESILKKEGESFGLKGVVVAQLVYDLPNTSKFHKKKSVAIKVDFIRFKIYLICTLSYWIIRVQFLSSFIREFDKRPCRCKPKEERQPNPFD